MNAQPPLPPTKTETQGFSPKVFIPAGGMIFCGVVLLLLGFDVEGKTLIATGVAALPAGYFSPNKPTIQVTK